jgi:tetratricopeptide (TPR) repeat protein
MKTFLFQLFLLIFAASVFAADSVPDFSTANKLYAEGRYPEAADLYGKILATGVQSPALLFNNANAEFKSGHLGAAIASYRRAAQLSPHDAEIRANLAFVRNQVQGSSNRDGRWQEWLGQLSLNEWTLFAVGSLWLTFILLAAVQLKPTLAPKFKNATRLLAALTIFFGAIVGVQAANHFSHSTAVVTANGLSARSGPFDEAQAAFVVHDGAEFPILDRHEDWLQVDAGAGKTGWLPAKQIAVLVGD